MSAEIADGIDEYKNTNSQASCAEDESEISALDVASERISHTHKVTNKNSIAALKDSNSHEIFESFVVIGNKDKWNFIQDIVIGKDSSHC